MACKLPPEDLTGQAAETMSGRAKQAAMMASNAGVVPGFEKHLYGQLANVNKYEVDIRADSGKLRANLSKRYLEPRTAQDLSDDATGALIAVCPPCARRIGGLMVMVRNGFVENVRLSGFLANSVNSSLFRWEATQRVCRRSRNLRNSKTMDPLPF